MYPQGYVYCIIILTSLSSYQRSFAARRKGCRISISQIDEDSPLILQHRKQEGHSAFIVPDGPGSAFLSFNSGCGVRFACPTAGKNTLVLSNTTTSDCEVIAYCMIDSTFNINGHPYNFNSIRCNKRPQSTVKSEGYCDKNKIKKYHIGFNLKENFFGFIEICYDPEAHTTINTKHVVSRSIGRKETDVDRSSYFSKLKFGTDLAKHPDGFYKCKYQIENFEKQLGSREQVRKYINCSRTSDMYLAKGHLVPNADFVFGYLQRATSYYINTAPQWQTMNAGNWKVLENRIRLYAHSRNTDLTVITGTLNVATLPDTRSQEHQLYMTTDANNNPTVPVPVLFWKLVHDVTKNAGIVFVGVNDPHHKNLQRQGYTICTDICNSASSWFKNWNRFDIENGYVYCCSVDDFAAKSKLKFLPNNVKQVLR